ncbi:beta strand repeat-containing protein [Aestuariibius insulae]|uniref:beta strand repeat-containing protein n=1 Tax=Aestuariibius insulae TaxID=2058287 RepID=UPI00345E2F73
MSSPTSDDDESTITVNEAVIPGSITIDAEGYTVESDGSGIIGDTSSSIGITMGNEVEAEVSSALDGNFSVGGDGTLNLSGDQGAVDSLNISGSDIVVTNEGALGGIISVDGGAAFSSNGALSGNVTANGSNLSLQGTTQAITANGGVITLGASGALNTGTGDITVQGTAADGNATATIESATSTNNISVSGVESGGTIFTGELTVNAPVDADGQLSVGEYGTVNLNAAVSDSDNGETVSTTVAENGTLNLSGNGSLDGSVDNAGELFNDGTISGLVTNNGRVRASGDFGDVQNNATRRFEVEGNSEASGIFVNEGIVTTNENNNVRLSEMETFTNANGGLINGAGDGILIVEADTIELREGSNVEGRVRLRGDIENDSDLNFNVFQQLTGDLNNRNRVTIDVNINAQGNTVDNQSVMGNPGTIVIRSNGGLNNVGLYENAGITRIEANGNARGRLQASTINNTGTLDVDGRVIGQVINQNEIDLNGEIDGTLNNSGTANLAGRITNNVFITGAGLATVDGNLTVNGDINLTNTDMADDTRLRIIGSRLVADEVVSNGTIFVNGRGTLEAALIDNNGAMDSDGQVVGILANEGRLDIEGGLSGRLDNLADLTTITGDLDVTGQINNDAEFRVSGGNLTVSQLFDNDGLVTVGDTRTLTAQNMFENDGTGTLRSGGRIVGDIDNRGTAELSNTVVGDLTTFGGGETNFVDTMNLEGGLRGGGGQVNVRAGTTTVDSISYGGTLTVDEGTRLVSRNADTDTNTGGIVNVNGTLASSQFENNGQMNLVGTFDGRLENDGSLVMIGGRATGPVNSLGSIRVAADPSPTETSQIDSLLTLESEGGDRGELTVEGTLLADVENSGVVRVRAGGELRGDVRAENRGVTDVVSNGLLTGSIQNNGSSTANINGRVTGNITNTQDAITRLRGTLDGSLTNSGTAEARGLIGRNFTNSGEVDLTGDLTVNGNISSSGEFSMSGGNLSAAMISNSGTFEVSSSRTLTLTSADNPVFTNFGADGNLTNQGTIIGNVRNEAPATMTSTSVINGDVSNLGTALLSGTITDQLQSSGEVTVNAPLEVGGGVSNSGLFSINGSLETTQFTNLGSGNTSLDGTLTSSLVNGGNFAVETGSRILGDVQNSGVIALAEPGTLRISGNLNNAFDSDRTGRVTSAGNGSLGDTIRIDGDLNGGEFVLDADLSGRDENASTDNAADTVVVSGDVSGTINLVFDLADTPVGPQSNILVFDVQDGDTDFNFTATGLPSAGEAIIYAIGRGEGGDLFISDQVNPAIGAIAGNITLTQSLIGSIVNRPSSPFVIGLAYDDEDSCGVGGWTRALGGTAEVNGTTKTDEIELESTLSATYSGIQFGGDYACFNGFYNGWDLAFGGIGGVNVGKTEQPVFALDLTGTRQLKDQQTSKNEVDFRQTYLGVYMTANRGPFSADLQYRIERTDFEISNEARGGSAGLGLDQEFESRAQTLSGSASYFMPIGETGFGFIPTAGFAFTRTETDEIEFDSGTLEIKDSQSNVGFVGATLSRSQFAENGLSALNYFGTATIYSDFADDPESVFTRVDEDGNDVIDKSTSSNLGTYGEVSAGVNYIRILDPGQLANARQFNASVRADARFSEDVESYGLTAQVRIQF